MWLYIARENIELPSLYFAHEREVFERDGMLYTCAKEVPRLPTERPFVEKVRFRTIGDMTCTGAVRSEADSFDPILTEVLTATSTERGATRADDRQCQAAMDERKQEGYF